MRILQPTTFNPTLVARTVRVPFTLKATERFQTRFGMTLQEDGSYHSRLGRVRRIIGPARRHLEYTFLVPKRPQYEGALV